MRHGKKLKVSKKRANAIHVRERANQRYGIDLDKNKQRTLVRKIRESSGIYAIRRLSGTRVLHKVPFYGRDLWVVYDSAQNNLITVLPQNPLQARTAVHKEPLAFSSELPEEYAEEIYPQDPQELYTQPIQNGLNQQHSEQELSPRS